MIIRFLFFLALVSPVYAQVIGGETKVLLHWDGANADQNIGEVLAAATDINADGFDDIIIGDRRAAPGGRYNAGSVYVYSGIDGALIHQWDGTNVWDYFGEAVAAAGDVNQDGFDDVLVGSSLSDPGGVERAGSVYLYSGASGQILMQWDGFAENDLFGTAVANSGDVNGDGIPDILIGATHTDTGGIWTSGSAYVFSGADGSLLHQWNGTSRLGLFGSHVASAGDIDADGFADVMIQSPWHSNGPIIPAEVFLYSGNDGSLLYSWSGEYTDSLGNAFTSIGDVNGDGFDDVLIGAPRGSSPFEVLGSVSIYSGADGCLLHQLMGAEIGGNFGISVSTAGDINQDGVRDYMIGSLGSSLSGVLGAGSVFFYSGKTFEELHRWDGINFLDQFGESLAFAGDTNGDGLPDYLIGIPNADPAGKVNAGTALLQTFHPFLRSSALSISASTGGVVQLDLDFPPLTAFHEYKILISATGLGPSHYGIDIPLSRDNLVDHTFLGNYPMPASNMQGVLDTFGNASASFTAPAGFNPGLIGRTFHLAAIANQPGQMPEFSSVAVAIEMTP